MARRLVQRHLEWLGLTTRYSLLQGHHRSLARGTAGSVAPGMGGAAPVWLARAGYLKGASRTATQSA